MKQPREGGAWEWHQDFGYWYNNGCLRPDMLSIYISLGYAFGSNIETLSGILGNLSMALAMLALAAFLGWRLKLAVQAVQARSGRKSEGRQ